MSIEQRDFGKLADGRAADLFVLRNRRAMTVKITNYGGIVTELHVPDRNGASRNIVLGFDDLGQYLQPGIPYFGALIGRVANRIGGARFTLDGQTIHVTANTPPHTLHGGRSGFDKKIWTARAATDDSLVLRYVSPDGEEGFPGALTATVTYTLPQDRDELVIDFAATTDKPTVVNLTNHSYFNLRGAGNGTVLDHVLSIAADRYTPSNEQLIPTGSIESVDGTPLDFRKPTRIGQRIDRVGGNPGGYDHNYVLDRSSPVAARVFEPTTGRVMEVLTRQPGIQLYTGNFLDGSIAGLGGRYPKHAALCLETQHFPDAMNHADFPSVVLRPGQTYKQSATYRFSAE